RRGLRNILAVILLDQKRNMRRVLASLAQHSLAQRVVNQAVDKGISRLLGQELEIVIRERSYRFSASCFPHKITYRVEHVECMFSLQIGAVRLLYQFKGSLVMAPPNQVVHHLRNVGHNSNSNLHDRRLQQDAHSADVVEAAALYYSSGTKGS